ncbi:J domain-containing protein [Flammeovirga kamogawensis]|uniref:DnaJ domain-containing protein n=1 Tax=Flammeovirga kamogawensis TaxID=373891 RepID=A0ABX8GWQ6_9BACT|nr:DnaJ domain-containing protein [Flammeovirga kamogawensis]MBB6461062.1 curved DNA-binding protein CbpA [Flammeovirga kamogawensis]QWG07632.1 DnaJ domain-containing protein [Flammeovirga kamogawensis]TRX69442.1 J domain-containing protein [Flammeovirga kamogawensis]
MSNFYNILGVDKKADKRQIKKAYLSLAKKYHPDVAGNDPLSEDKFKLINEAYNTLSDDSKKFHYDQGSVFSSTNIYNTTTPSTPPPSRTSREENRRSERFQAKREEYKESVQEEKKSNKKNRKKYIPAMVAGYVAIMVGVISFFVDRQSKLAAEAYANAKTNLEVLNTNKALSDAQLLSEYDAYTESKIIFSALLIVDQKEKTGINELLALKEELNNNQNSSFDNDINYYLGRAYFNIKNKTKAIATFKEILKKDKNNTAVNYWLGRTLNELSHDYDDAAKCFEISMNNDNYKTQSILRCGIALQNDRQYNLSEEYLLTAVDNPTTKAIANYHLGWHYFLSKHDNEKACIYWKLSAKQGNPEALYQVRRNCR